MGVILGARLGNIQSEIWALRRALLRMLLRCSANGHCLWAPLVGSAVGLCLDWFAFLLLVVGVSHMVLHSVQGGLAGGDFLLVLVLFLLVPST